MSVWETNGGVYLGYHVDATEGQPAPGAMLRYKNDRHICWIGNSGAGKSRRLLLPNLAMLTGWSMLVVDPKGELLRMCDAHRRRLAVKTSYRSVRDFRGDVAQGLRCLQPSIRPPMIFPTMPWGRRKALSRSEIRTSLTGQYSFQDFLAGVVMFARLVLPDASYAMCARWLLNLTPRCAT